ncbi:centrosomal protein 120 [Ectocarpus siliculosus]|uniref:Centrosomal protein 120 n=1 Tax=Ectocarpus siliculosus TaxID=2880 RepID=D7FXH9_ECTSI|nr:centrosomal protein 120 [Ectocarpus siliculosus]|eukprot:CBJ32316.1 centrosomal protein 120 [Ectocarpus siliculosus]
MNIMISIVCAATADWGAPVDNFHIICLIRCTAQQTRNGRLDFASWRSTDETCQLNQSFFNEEKERELALRQHGQQHGHQHGRGSVDYRRCLRAQANIANETRETGNSAWGRGVRSRQATWLRGADKLSWSLPEQQFKQVKAYTPVCKVHVYVTDPNSPTMDTSDSVGWFIVDMRDLAGQRQQERWVKLQGASPAEVLISSSLAMARDPQEDPGREGYEQQGRPNSGTGGHRGNDSAKLPASGASFEGGSPTAASERTMPLPVAAAAAAGLEDDEVAVHTGVDSTASEAEAPLAASTAVDAVSDLDALPVGPGADGQDARTFSLAISVKGAAGLSGLAAAVAGGDGGGPAGFWLSYSIFGVVVQTDRFESLGPPPPGGGAVLEPMMDSFRLRATLQGLCRFLAEAPPLQVYLCTEGRILAHADVDMSLLLPTEEWQGRSTCEFGSTGMEGDFQLHLPGEPLAAPQQRDEYDGGGEEESRDPPVVSICAELTKADSEPGPGDELVGSPDAGGLWPATATAAAAAMGRTEGSAGASGVKTWSRLAVVGKRVGRAVAITAALQRLELRPVDDPGSGDGSALSNRVNGGGGVLVGITDATRELLLSAKTGGAATATDAIAGVANANPSASFRESFRVVGCGERGEVDTEDSDFLETITWEWEGEPPNPGREGGVGGVLAAVQVLGGSGARHGDVTIATGVVPWPSSACGGRQHVNVKLMSPEGNEAEEPPVVGSGAVAGGAVPRRYRMSINLASVKDLENAAYVVACYHYPYFGTSAPVRTSMVWAAPRMDTPLSNSCCTFSFGMSFDRLAATVQDRSMVVSLRNKDRFKEEEVGVVTIPLQDVVESPPQYFRCRDTGKTFTSMAGFKAHLKARQRAGVITPGNASGSSPVEVKVLDRYLTVASVNNERDNNDQVATSPPSSLPSRLCSLRVILLLEDMGPTGDPNDQANLPGLSQTIDPMRPSSAPPMPLVPPTAQSPEARSTGTGMATGAGAGLPQAAAAAVEAKAARAEAEVDLERARVEWERWRVVEEAKFAKRLREKDEALEQKWEAREATRRRELSHAQADYSKLEGKLRKALSEVGARERQLKAREESWKTDHAQKLSELQLLQRRLREETKHQVDLERMKVKALEKQVASHAKSLEDARARAAATDEDLERFRQQQRRTPEGGLRQEVYRLGAAKAEAEAQIERERSLKNKALLEKEEYRANIHKLARALRHHQERETTCARREMEQLRLEYLAREERFMLDGDRNELRTIKQELDELRHVSLVQEAQAGLAKINPSTIADATPTITQPPLVDTRGPRRGESPPPTTNPAFPDPGPSPSLPPRPTPAPAQVSVQQRRESGPASHGGSVDADVDCGGGASASGPLGGDVDGSTEMRRLIEWRDELLATGMYTPQNPIVSELNRRISLAGGSVGGRGSSLLQREE